MLFRSSNRPSSFASLLSGSMNKKQSNKKDPAGKTMGEQLGTALQLPAQAAGGLLLSTMSGVFGKLGGIGKIFAPLLIYSCNLSCRDCS